MLIRVGARGKEGRRAVVGVVERVVNGVVVYVLLKELVDVEGYFAPVVLHANAVEVRAPAVYVRNVDAAQHVHGVRVVERVVVIGRGAHVPAHLLQVGLLVESAVRQHRYRQCVGVCGIFVQVVVGVAYQRVVHSPVS